MKAIHAWAIAKGDSESCSVLLCSLAEADVLDARGGADKTPVRTSIDAAAGRARCN